MKILNLYACLGGNRYKWNETKEDIEVTAVEIDPELARLYQERFPNDKVIVADAHQYLLDHYKEFDFIWTSPPCTTHSRATLFNTGSGPRKKAARYPDMKLYQEIIFLQSFYKGLFCVENVLPYYEPLIKGQQRGRHIYWTNFNMPSNLYERPQPSLFRDKQKAIENFHEINLDSYKGQGRKDQIARNLVDFETGRQIFQAALGVIQKSNIKQIELL